METSFQDLDFLIEAIEDDKNDYLCENEEDPRSLQKLEELDSKRIFNMQGKCFDLKNLFEWVYNRQNYTNPFTNQRFNNEELKIIKREAIQRFPLLVEIAKINNIDPKTGVYNIDIINQFQTSQFTNIQRIFINCMKLVFNNKYLDLKEAIKLSLNNESTEFISFQISGTTFDYKNSLYDILLSDIVDEPILHNNSNRIRIYITAKKNYPASIKSQNNYRELEKLHIDAAESLVQKVFGTSLSQIVTNQNVMYYLGPSEYPISGRIKITFSKDTKDEKPFPQNDVIMSFHKSEFEAGYRKKYNYDTTIKDFLMDLINSVTSKMGNLGMNDQIAVINGFSVNVLNETSFTLADTIGAKFKNKVDRNGKIRVDIYINNDRTAGGYGGEVSSFSIESIMAII